MGKTDLRSDTHEFSEGTIVAVSPAKGDKYLIIKTVLNMVEISIEVPIDKINDAIDDVEAWERAACYAARQKLNSK